MTKKTIEMFAAPRCLIFFAMLFLLSIIAFAQNFKHFDGEVIWVNDFSQPVAGDVPTTYLQLLGQHFSKVEFDPETPILAKVGENSEIKIVSHARAVWFVSGGRENLALIVHLKDPRNIRSGYVFSSKLSVFRLIDSRLKLLDWLMTELPSNAATADFYSDFAVVPMRGGKNAEHAFTVFETKNHTLESKIVQKFRLFALENNRLKVVLDDLPALAATNKCFDYENEQMLREVTAQEPRNGRFKLKLLILDYFTTSRDCESARKNRFVKASTYEAVWNRRRGIYKTRLKSVEADESLNATATSNGEKWFEANCRSGISYF